MTVEQPSQAATGNATLKSRNARRKPITRHRLRHAN